MNSLKIFEKYVKTFDLNNPKIRLKYQHSLKVAKICKHIALKEGLDPDISYDCGLFHDIGRFEQVSKYDTFWDSKSIDHGDYGSDIIENIIDSEHIDIIKTSIKYHNKFTLPELNIETQKYVKLTRDADKIDIFRVFFKYYSNEKNIDDLLDADDVTDTVTQKILNNEGVGYQDVVSSIDFKCIKFSWMYDLNYQTSYDLIKDRRYIDIL